MKIEYGGGGSWFGKQKHNIFFSWWWHMALLALIPKEKAQKPWKKTIEFPFILRFPFQTSIPTFYAFSSQACLYSHKFLHFFLQEKSFLQKIDSSTKLE